MLPPNQTMLENPAMAAFGYSTSQPSSTTTAALSRSQRTLPPDVAPCTFLLRDHTPATVYPIINSSAVPIGLLAFLCDELNVEIERGETFPMLEPLPLDAFQSYWFSSFAAIMLLGDEPSIMDNRDWSKECFGAFYIKPNYPGRSAHVCSAGFIVAAHARAKGIGRVLGECYINWAPKLGYTYSVFNLVFETNVAARRIWESIGFKRIGRVKGAAILKGHDHPVDAIMYGRDLVGEDEDPVGELRFDRIKFYLETGRYPPQADRQEKSRLRSSAVHYKIRDGNLMLKDREVVSDTDRQLAIATEVHMNGHVGINKTTSTIAEKYHWTRIKETAATVIRLCPVCRVNSRVSQPSLSHPLLQHQSGQRRNIDGLSTSQKSTMATPVPTQATVNPSHATNGRNGNVLGHDDRRDENVVASDNAAAAVAAAAVAAMGMVDSQEDNGVGNVHGVDDVNGVDGENPDDDNLWLGYGELRLGLN
ncbi:hypothetical protein BZA70DRAFT_280763 [Myxozyma melibiosi]|uniref:N-acetyltransferase domain-containing protein n=1 Tax=Myxozyma melibiosi TaxID=54550 RepID=A0ABR1F3N4_9ASCO